MISDNVFSSVRGPSLYWSKGTIVFGTGCLKVGIIFGLLLYLWWGWDLTS